MNAQAFVIEGKKMWYCGKCKRVYLLKNKAEECCKDTG